MDMKVQHCFSLSKKQKKITLDFSKELVKVLEIYFTLIKYQYKMTQYNTWSAKLSNLKLKKLKWEIKNGTKVTLKISSNVVGDSNDENSFPHKLLLTNTIVKAFENNPQLI